jgi:hypothetical protein
MKGLPLGLQETIRGFAERSPGVDEKAISYHACAIVRPVISQKRTIDPKVGRIVTKVGREKSISQPKIRNTPRNFMPFLTARVCFRCATTAKLSDNGCPTAGRRAILAVGAAMLCSLCIAMSYGYIRVWPLRSNVRQNYASTAAYLSDKSHRSARK